MPVNKHGLRLDPDFTEDLVGFALESFLTLFTFPRRRFSIEPFSRVEERRLGADARLDSDIRGFRPFYMQFKRPFAFLDASSSKVVKERKKLGARVEPHSLFFDLRRKQPHHNDFQHNILYDLRNELTKTGMGDAAYVCPLFLDRSAYRWHLQWSGLRSWLTFRHWRPWDLEEVLIRENGRSLRFDNVPILAEHVTIPPHKKVQEANHRYSFDESGSDVCFHSPARLPELSVSLAKFLTKLSYGFLEGGEKLNFENASQFLKRLIVAVDGDRGNYQVSTRPERDDPIGDWLAWGDYLQREYEIQQYALVQWEY